MPHAPRETIATADSPPAAALTGASPGVAPPVPRWAIHRRLYDWVLSLAHHKHSTTALFLLSFAESSFFPVPPDVLQIALTLERPRRAWWYAAVSTVASVLGALIGYLIGFAAWQAVDDFFFKYVFSREAFEKVQQMYVESAFEAIFLAAFTPIPYKVFTVTAGVAQISIVTLVLASIIGRGTRFFLVAALLAWFGPSIKTLIDRYFNLACLILGVLAIGGVLAIKLL